MKKYLAGMTISPGDKSGPQILTSLTLIDSGLQIDTKNKIVLNIHNRLRYMRYVCQINDSPLKFKCLL